MHMATLRGEKRRFCNRFPLGNCLRGFCDNPDRWIRWSYHWQPDNQKDRHLLLLSRRCRICCRRCSKYQTVRKRLQGKAQGLWAVEGFVGHHQWGPLPSGLADNLEGGLLNIYTRCRLLNTSSCFTFVTALCICTILYINVYCIYYEIYTFLRKVVNNFMILSRYSCI